MKIFISWSGERSKLVALLLKDWIGSVIQAAKPWVSDRDIARGAQWFTEITNILSDSKIGIVCLTEENKNNPWILFESGALVKGLPENRLCTFLIDLKPTNIQPPLSQFNHTEPNRDSMLKLVTTINDSAGENKLSDGVLTNVFNTFFPVFEKSFNQILAQTPIEIPKQTKNQTELLEEVLLTVRNLEKETYGKDTKMIELLRIFIQNQKEANDFYHIRYNQALEKLRTTEDSIKQSKISALDKIRNHFVQGNLNEQSPSTTTAGDDDLKF